MSWWWPYEVIPLTDQEKHLRRLTLDQYAQIACLSSFLPVLIALSLRLTKLTIRAVSKSTRRDGQGAYTEVPLSPIVKAKRLSRTGISAKRWRILKWWMQDDFRISGTNWGRRDEWILGLAWFVFMLALTVLGTGKDYFHLTKRVGLIAVSQFPVQYLMALKALNPVAWVFRSSHEVVNRYHRVLGRITYSLLLIHIVLYNGYFLHAGIWFKRFFAPIVFYGVLASLFMHALFGTATATIRHLSYRLFFITHVTAAILVPALIFFHAHAARKYIVTSGVIFLVDLAIRRLTIHSTTTVIENIPGTTLVKITAPLPQKTVENLRSIPGCHIYLNLPPAGRAFPSLSMKSLLFEFVYNPFTVASISERDNAITLVVRRRDGPMTRLLAEHSAKAAASSPQISVELNLGVQGPYGSMKYQYHDLVTSGINNILLVAGGVGATFAVPLYHAISTDMHAAKLQFVWAIRAAGDATWAVPATAAANGKGVLNDTRVKLFLTEDVDSTSGEDSSQDAQGVELTTMMADSQGRTMMRHNRRRPDFQKIVDETFRLNSEEKVAILVCGPDGMAAEVRRHVHPWVTKGRIVWWHDESFGW